MPDLVRQGPFSYDSNGYSANKTYNLVKAAFVADKGDILEVLINGVKIVGEGANATGDEFTVNSLTNPTSITVATTFTTNDPATSSALVFTSGTIIVKRLSNRATPVVDFAPGSVIREQDLDNSTNQTLHVAQEAMDIAISGMVLQANDKFDGKGKVIENVDVPVAANDVVTKTYLEDTWLTATDKTNSATVAGISANVTTVAGIASNVTAVAGDATDIGVVAGKATEIGRLGTADTVADMVLLGTTDCVADMALLGTADCVADMALLGTADCVADMNTLATNDIVADLNTLATSDIVDDLAILGDSAIVTNLATVSTNVASVNTAATNIANINTAVSNIATINDFADKYRIASSAPSSDNDDGDLYYNTTSNQLNVHDGSSWGAIGQTEAQTIVTANNAAVAMAIALG